MPDDSPTASLVSTAVSVGIGAVGYLVAHLLSVPAPVLVGPAVAVSLAGLAGIRTSIDPVLRDACFVVLGFGIGCGFDASAGAAVLRWPLAFLALTVALGLTLWACRDLLVRSFGFDPRSAVLASAPGHLSYVMSLAVETGSNVGRVAVVQSIRLLALTLIVPFAALAMGYPMGDVGSIGGPPMGWGILVLLLVTGAAAGLILRRFRVTAPLLLGPMIVAGLTHVGGTVEGGVPVALLTPAFLVLGTLIGTRFSGMSIADLRDSALAGTGVTVVGAALATVAAIPVALSLGLPLAHVLVAFAPGGLETMIALGAVLGVSPGFVAACHIMRLFILSAMIPIALRRSNNNSRT